jgi:hypothetical protein
MKVIVVWHMMPCSLLDYYGFGEPAASTFYRKDGGDWFVRSVGKNHLDRLNGVMSQKAVMFILFLVPH